MSSQTDAIRALLASRLATIQVSGAPYIAVENEAYEPTTGVIFLRDQLIPAVREPVGMAASDSVRHDGIYQVTVFYPSGSYKARFTAQGYATQIENLFPHALTLGTSVKVRVIRAGRVPAFQDLNTAWMILPVEIHYTALS